MSLLVVQSIDKEMRSTAAPSAGTLTRLAHGLVAYGRGRAKLARGEYVPARADLLRARSELRAAGNSLALAADVQLAVTDLQLRHLERVLASVPQAIAVSRRLGCRSTEARGLVIVGLAHWYRFEIGPALVALRRALALYDRLGERGSAAGVANSLAGVLRLLHDRAGSWAVLRTALYDAAFETSPLRRYLMYFNASLFALEDGLLDAALTFQDSALGVLPRGVDGPRAEGIIRRALLLARVGRDVDARAELQIGRAALDSLSDADVAEYLGATADVVEATLAMRHAPGDAAGMLAAAISYFERAEPIAVPPLLLARARALRQSGQAVAADDALEAGIRLLEERRSRLAPDLRTAYFGDGRELFADLVASQVNAGAPARVTLQTAERGKGRTLAEQTARSSSVTNPVLASKAAPGTVTIVSWFVLPERLLTWIVRGGEIRQREISVTRQDLAHAVGGQTRPFSDDVNRQLTGWLISPIADLLPPGGTLVLSPHDVLGALAPAALYAPSGRRLVEDYVLVTTPSIVAFEHASARLRRLDPAPPRSLLAIADPLFDRTAFPTLSRLPAARAEVQEIGRNYSRSLVFTGALATRASLLEGLADAEVVHVAAHGQANESSPGLSYLVMAPSGEDGGLLLAKDLVWRRPVRTRIAVLGSCRSAAGPDAAGEGVQSLATPFLMAGVPSVIAALWDVDDDASRELLVRLHKGIAAGLAGPDALRAAQRVLIASGDSRLTSVRAWSGFVAIGGASW
jgi:CHAT domain-containing protein